MKLLCLVATAGVDEAVGIASPQPAARVGEHLGFAIEVRPLEFFEQL